MDIFTVTVTGSLTFVNVTLTGKYMIWSDCIQEWCTHCLTDMYLYPNSEGKKVTVIDQHVVNVTDTMTPYYIHSQCSFYKGYLPNNQAVFFTLSIGASLIFRNVEIDNIRVQAQNFIVATGGNYIGFLNTSIIRMDFAQALVAESSKSFTSVVVEFNGAYVTGLNRDHPYSLAYGIDAGLLSLSNSNLDIVYIRNSVFEYNFMLVSNARSNQFIYISVTHLEITSSVFRSCMGGFYFNMYDDSGSTDLVTISNVTFDSNLFEYGSVVTFDQVSGNRHLLLTNSTFINNISHESSILRIDAFFSSLTLTMLSTNFMNNRLVTSTEGIINLYYVTSVVIAACTISENLVFDPSFPYNVFKYLLDNGLIIDSPDLQANEFSAGVTFSFQLAVGSSTILDVSRLQMHTSKPASHYGLDVFISSDLTDAFTITDSSFSSIGSIELYVGFNNPTTNTPEVYLRNCDFIGPNIGGIYLSFLPSSGGGVIVESSRFLQNGSPDRLSGGIIMYGWFMNITDCVFDGNQGTYGGGVTLNLIGNYTQVLDEYHRAVYITNTKFINDFASLKGGDFNIVSLYVTFPLLLHIGNCTFTNSTGLNSGGSLLFDLMAFSSVLIENCAFVSGSTYTGGMIHAADISGAVTIRNSSFRNILVSNGYIIRFGSMRKTSLTLSNSEISDCSCYAGVYISISSEMRVASTSNRFQSNRGIVIWTVQGTFSDSDSVFYNNSYTYSPCYYQDKQVAIAEFIGTVFRGNWATDTIGVVMISAGSTASFRNCRFEGNSAGNMTGVMQVEMSSSVTISGCEFLYNQAASAATLSLLEISSTTPLNLSDSVFIGNSGNGLLQMIDSNMNAQNITIKESQSPYIAGLILIQSNLSLVSSSITQTNGTLGCVFYGVLDSNVIMTESIVSDIICERESMLLLSNLYSELQIRKSSLTRVSSLTASIISVGNIGQLVLDTVQVSSTESPLAVFSLRGVSVSVAHSLFIDTNSVALLAEESTLLVINSIFENVTALTGVGAVNCTNCASVCFSEVIFTNVSATNTAGVSITGSNSVSLTQCRFEGLVSGTYGALAVETDSLSITDSSFIHNQASGEQSYGGAAFISTKDFNILSGNVFIGNSATNGGALYLTSAQPVNILNVFEGNSAVYGNNIASYAVNMRLVNDSVPIAASGQVFTDIIYVELFDHYGFVVKTDNSSIAWMSSNSSLAGNLKGTAYQGVFNFSQFTITDTPNSPVTITISSSSLSLTVSLDLRPCLVGEILSSQGCLLCKPGTYTVKAGGTTCSTCLPNAECPGDSIPYPRPGFWRPEEWYDGIFECPLASACLGSVNYTNSTGVCADGYTGNMCQSCASNHFRDGKDICTPCLSNDTYMIGQAFLGSGILVFFVLLLMASLLSATNETNYSGVLLKMFLNYLHFTVLVAHFNMLWPEELQGMFQIYEYLGNSGEQFMLWDCAGSELFFREIVIIAVLPAVLILANLLLWSVSQMMCRTQKTIRNFLCLLSISLAFIHPLVVRVAFSAFRCITIKPDERWLRFEMNLTCWDSTHRHYALAAALPTLILWGFGLPVLILFIFIKYRKQLQEQVELRHDLSFLCMGYKPAFFYWELIKIGTKLLVVVLYVFMSCEHISLQALTLCILLWASAAIQFKYSAFASRLLNRAELRCIWVSIITSYSGIWYSSQSISHHAEMVLFALTVLTHLYFLLLWSILLIRTLGLALIKTHPRVAKLCPRMQYVFHIEPTSPTPVVHNLNAMGNNP